MKPEWKSFLMDAGAEFSGAMLVHFGNPERERRMVLSGPVFADLSHFGLLEVHGPDARNFLQAQLATNLTSVSTEQASFACYLSAQGKVLCSCILLVRGDGFYLFMPREQLEDTLNRLRRFVLRARVTLEDASEAMIRLGIAGEALTADLQTVFGCDLPNRSFAVVNQEERSLVRLPGAAPRWLALGSFPAMKELWGRVQVRGAPVGPQAWDLLAIQAGEPFITPETADHFIPQMLNLDALGAVGFGKGCYPGQEIVTRVRHRGEIKRRLRIGLARADVSPRPGMHVAHVGEKGSEVVGTVIAAARHPDGGFLALAVLQQDAMSATALQLPECGNAPFQLRELPYPLPDR